VDRTGITVGAVGGHGGGICGLEEVAEVLPLAPPGLALGILVRHLHLLERQRRRQHHLRPHYLRLHPLILSRAGEVEQDETKSPAVPSLRALGDVGCRRAVAELESHGLRPCLKQHGKPETNRGRRGARVAGSKRRARRRRRLPVAKVGMLAARARLSRVRAS